MTYLRLLFFLLVPFTPTTHAQTESEPKPNGPDRSIKYPMERYKNERIKNIRQGREIRVYLKNEDTLHTLYGELVNVSDEEVVLSTFEERKLMDYENNYFEQSFVYEESKCLTIPVSTIESLEYDNWYNGYVNLFAGLSGVSALLVAPLVSIDKDQPNRFNSQRYKNIVVPSLICLGAGVSLAIILEAGENRFKLKPKLR
jgi:hypothetical protein